MFTILKVRDGVTSYEVPGWYPYPPGTLVEPASPEDRKRDGIEGDGSHPPSDETPAYKHGHGY
jgi:hypothetical protein